MLEVFVAYASGNQYHAEIIRKASANASSNDRKILPWIEKDTSGLPIAESVESWIQRSDAFIADVSVVNDNVTYELGFAIGLAKPVRLIRSEHVSPTTRRFMETGDLLDPRRGRGFYNTYPARWPGLRYPLDYIFCTRQFRIGSMKVLPSFGSDHLPLVAEFVLAR